MTPKPSEAEAIKAAHPLRSGRHDLYAEAMRLVGERHQKSDLIDLVTWLLLESETRAADAAAYASAPIVLDKAASWSALATVAQAQQARAEAAEKRVAELEEERDELREMVVAMDRGDKRAVTAELSAALRQLSRIEAKRPLPPDVLANALQDRVHPASGRLLSASPVVARPDAAVREALVGLYDAAMLSHGCMLETCRYACPTHLVRLTKALAAARAALPELTGKEGAEAGERKPVCATCNDTHNMTLRDREVMCTRCPIPCNRCRRRPQGPFCAVTPCPCACHDPKEAP